MEIFERMSWYGFYAVSSLYLTGNIDEGGLGFSSEDRGVIQGLSTFFLYLFPAVFGAIADRYGYKRMLLASCAVMFPAYLLLQLPTTFYGFFGVYILVAIGHGMFKPVVLSTIARCTNPKTASMGFGIFYMMVNVGGFIGPIIAGVVRGWSWSYVFIASASWIVVLALTCLFFYKEPPVQMDEGSSTTPKIKSQQSLSAVMQGMISVVGNGRFFLLVVGLLCVLVMGSKYWNIETCAIAAVSWLSSNLLLDVFLRARSRSSSSPLRTHKDRFLQPMRIGEGRYMLFLLLMAGFWTSFNQIFMTLPEYIRDYGQTEDLVASLTPAANSFASVLEAMGIDTSGFSKAALVKGKVKPEFLINLNALGIILGQLMISFLMRNIKPLSTIVNGVLVTIVSFIILDTGESGATIAFAILVFSVGEMMASPKAKEYAGRLAPPDKVAMYMGYFFWCTALGNLFGGLLSGAMYQHYGPKGIDDPGQMWYIFAALGGTTAVSLKIYDRWIHRNPPKPA